MEFILNYVLAWVGILLAVSLCVIYILRLVEKKIHIPQTHWFKQINQVLRRYHKPLGMLLALVGLIHGLYSSDKILSFNLGTLLWGVSLALGLNWLFRRYKHYPKSWIHLHRILALAFVLLIPIHIIDVGGIAIDDEFLALLDGPRTEFVSQGNAKKPLGEVTEPQSRLATTEEKGAISAGLMSGLTFEDGVYTGVADAYGPGLTVEVTVKDHAITQVTIVHHNEEKQRFYAYPMAVIPEAIIAGQTTAVDSITGATFTSVGIKNAVRNALESAVLTGQLPEQEALPADRRGRNH